VVSAEHQPHGARRLPSPRHWSIWAQKPRLIALVLSVQLAATLCVAWALFEHNVTGSSLGRLAFFAILGIAYEEASRRVADLRLRIAGLSYFDMTSVWTFAGALALPPLLGFVLVVIIRFYMWWRYQRNSRSAKYRHVYTAASIVIACEVAHVVDKFVLSLSSADNMAVAASFAILLSIVAYRAVQAGIIAVAVYVSDPMSSPRTLLGDRDANAFEIATLSLGGMLAMIVEPTLLLGVLVLAPMVVLQRGALVKELAVAATTDSKTGLLNASAWTQLAERDLARVVRERGTAVVLVLDMDHFKDVNDSHGHMVGDSALRAVADALTAELRDYDLVGRFGGEEFVAILPGMNVDDGVSAAERLRLRILRLEIPAADGSTLDSMLSASIGVAGFPQHGSELSELLQAGDVALYAAKRAGRNRVMAAETFGIKAAG